MLSEPKETAPEPILEGQASDRFDALGRPSPNDRYLREADLGEVKLFVCFGSTPVLMIEVC